MPELPEVETIVRNLAPRLTGRRILGFRSLWPRQILPSPAAVARAVQGRQILGLTRRGKLAVMELEGGLHLLIHFRMSGRLEWGTCGGEEPRHARAVWTLDQGERLVLCDARKFGRIRLVTHLAEATAHLGIEPLDHAFTPERLARDLEGRRRKIKPLLLDQRLVAGLGNIYTDEALHRAGIHPARCAGDLRPEEVTRLHHTIQEVLREGIEHRGASLDWVYPGGRMQDRLKVYGRAGEPCCTCGDPIQRTVLEQRGTHLCPTCQV